MVHDELSEETGKQEQEPAETPATENHPPVEPLAEAEKQPETGTTEPAAAEPMQETAATDAGMKEEIPSLGNEEHVISVEVSDGTASIGVVKDETSKALDFVEEMISRLLKMQAEHNFRDFWFYVKELNNFIFSSLRIKKEKKAELKERIGVLCDAVKMQQEGLRENLKKSSAQKREAIEKLIREANEMEPTAEGVELSFKKLEEAQRLMRQKPDEAEASVSAEESGFTRSDREALFQLIKTSKDDIMQRKRSIRQKNFETIANRLKEISDKVFYKNPREAFNQIKVLRNDMRNVALDRDHVKEIDGVINQLWKKAGEKVNERKEQDLSKRLSGMESLIVKNNQFIKRLHKEIDDIKVKWADVQNDMFKNRMNEWIEEKTQKIEKVTEENKSLAEKIAFLKEQAAHQ